MLAQALISTLALAASANAHAFVLSAWVDGEDTWDGTTVGEPASYRASLLSSVRAPAPSEG